MTIGVPLTFAQRTVQRMLSAHDGSPAGPYATFRIEGPLDVPALRKAAVEMARQHDALRFELRQDSAGSLRQHLLPVPAGDEILSCQHVHARSTAQFDRYVSGMLARDLKAGWADSSPYPFQLRLLRHGDELHALLAAFHRVAVDLQGVNVAMATLWRGYRDLAAGRPTRPSPPTRSLFAPTVPERDGPSEVNRRYWTEVIDRMPPGCAYAEHRGVDDTATEAFEVRLRRNAVERSGATEFQIAVAALAHATRAQTPVVYVPINTRRSRDRDMVGMCTLPLPLAFDPRADAARLLAQTQQLLVQAHLRRNVDFAELWHQVRGHELRHRCVVANVVEHRPQRVHELCDAATPLVSSNVYKPNLRYRTGTVDVTMVMHRYSELLKFRIQTEVAGTAADLECRFKTAFSGLLDANPARPREELESS
jgi:hypothetical protein